MSSGSELPQSAGHGLVRHCTAMPIGRIGTKVRDVIFMATLQRKSHLYFPSLGIARPQPQFPH